MPVASGASTLVLISLLPSYCFAPARIDIRVLYPPANQGKGGALKTGFQAATGGILVVQDADLEYDPNDWGRMYDFIARRGVADVVYGVPARALGRQGHRGEEA